LRVDNENAMNSVIDSTQYNAIARWSIFIPIGIFLVILVGNWGSTFFYFGIIILLVLIWAAWYMFSTKLLLKTSDLGISYQLKPFQKTEVFIPFDDILELDIEATDFLTKFGGWGKRKKGNEVAYVFNDRFFLKIKTADRTFYFSLSDDVKQKWKDFVIEKTSKTP